MKKIIDGKTYNTQTADRIANWSNGLGSRDFRNCDETLYKTKKGAWFIYGFGGAMSRWSDSDGNTSWASSNIIVLNENEALKWCERHDISTEIIEENFYIEEA